MNQKIVVVLFIVASAVITISQNCQPSNAADQLVTGTHNFQLNPYTSRVQCFTTPIPSFFNNMNPQITAGISNIAQFQLDSSGIDFTLRSHIVQSKTQASLTLIVNNGTWTAISTFYLISTRNDFEVGSYLSSADQLATCSKQQPYILQIQLPLSTKIASHQSTASLVFINGLRTTATGFNLQFSQPLYDSALKMINVTVVTNATSSI